MRRVVLSTSEVDKLTDFQKHSTNSVERNRSLMLLLSNQGNSMNKVAKMVGCAYQTVEKLLNAWEQADKDNRFSVLRQSKGQGAKVKLQPIENQIPELMEKHNRNLKSVIQEIENQHGIKICKLTLQNFLKDAGLYLQASAKIAQK